MSIHNTDLDEINNICSLVKEINELSNEVIFDLPRTIDNSKEFYKEMAKRIELINSKANIIRNKAQKMENRLKDYKTTIESLGFKRVKPKRKEK